MIIGLHDAEKEYFKHSKTFPNYALMKISAWHKAQGDTIEWWNPLYKYDRVYSSKVFDFTPDDPYLPEDAIRGGTGYRDIFLHLVLTHAIESATTVEGEYIQAGHKEYAFCPLCGHKRL